MTIRLHLGAHKTATTYIQELLLLNRSKSAANGLAYWPLSMVRPLVRNLIKVSEQQRQVLLPARFDGKAKAVQQARRDLAYLVSHDMPTTISEENILGDPEDCYVATFYPNAEQRLGFVVSAMPDTPIELYLCVRSYPDFLASIYGESIRHGGFIPIETFKAAHQSPEGQWNDLIDRLRGVVPQAKIIVWPYEGFRELEPVIVSRLSGIDYAEMARLPVARVLPSASSEAIMAMAVAAPSLSRPQRVFKMLALQHEFPAGEGTSRFDPWSPEERARMQAAYDQDLADIAARSDVTFLG